MFNGPFPIDSKADTQDRQSKQVYKFGSDVMHLVQSIGRDLQMNPVRVHHEFLVGHWVRGHAWRPANWSYQAEYCYCLVAHETGVSFSIHTQSFADLVKFEILVRDHLQDRLDAVTDVGE